MYSDKFNFKNTVHPHNGYNFSILGVSVTFGLTLKDVVGHVMKTLQDHRTSSSSFLISTVNSEFVMAAQKDKVFRDIINSSMFAVPDGAGVVMAKRFLTAIRNKSNPFAVFYTGLSLGFGSFFDSTIRQECLSGVDLFDSLLSSMNSDESQKYSVFLLGGFNAHIDDVSGATAAVLRCRYPNLHIIGSSSDFSWEPRDDSKTLDYIHSCMRQRGVSKLDVLAVAYGHVKQEKWISRNMSRIPVTVAIGLGGTFDFIAGAVSRAPHILRNLNLEWLYRLIVEPKRLKRVLTAFPVFSVKVFLSTLKHDRV